MNQYFHSNATYLVKSIAHRAPITKGFGLKHWKCRLFFW